MSFSIEFKNFSEVQKLPHDLAAKTNAVFLETANALILGAERAAQDQVLSASRKPQGRTGGYLKSIHSGVEANQFPVIGKVASDHPLAAVLEFGSRPHVIKPRNKKTCSGREPGFL